MAEKVLQTRIINKHADLSAWSSSSLKLKTGEIALARVETTKPDGHGGFYKVPTYLMKVGDGDKTFSQLEWLAAPASDVYEWAKASTKPAYGASEITRGSSNVAADLQAAEQNIQALQALISGDKTVAELIESAINALDVEDSAVAKQFVTAVSEADGKISVTRRELSADDIPTLEISKINGLQTALDAKAAKTYVDGQIELVTTAIGSKDDAATVDSVYGKIAAAKKAGDDAQKTIDDYKTANDLALAGVKETAEAATTVQEATKIASDLVDALATGQVKTNKEATEANASAISNLAGEGRTSETVKGNADAIALLKEQIGNVANVMNFRGVSVKGEGTEPGHDIADPKPGDVIIYGDAEYVYDESNAWVKFGDASDNAAAISGLQDRVGNIETRLNTGDIATRLTNVETAASDAQDAADAAQEHSEGVAKDLADEIARATQAEADNLAAAKKYAEDEADAAEGAAKSYTDAEAKKLSDSIDGLSSTVSENATTAANATKKVADDLAQYITDNDAALDVVRTNAQKGVDDAAAALKYAKDLEGGQVKTNKENIESQGTEISTIKNNYARVSGDKLVYGQGEAEMIIVFDCGGVEELA